MATNTKANKKPLLNLYSNLAITLFFIVVFTIPTLLLLHTPSTTFICSNLPPNHPPFSGDLRLAEFAWNKLPFNPDIPSPSTLRIAVFSKKWPTPSSAPGGMERHALTLHTAMARRGHRVHVFTSPLSGDTPSPSPSPVVHRHEGQPDRWQHDKAWEMFKEEDARDPFDAIHSESVALPFWLARELPNLAVSWHGIALESAHSTIYQDLARKPDDPPISPAFNESLQGTIPKVLNEIRFFPSYAHHVAISDSCGEMLRDVYQIPTDRVHVIVNGVDESDFTHDSNLGKEFRSKIGIPKNATLVLGVAGRLVKDKGHPLLHEAFSDLRRKHADVYLIVAGSGPWQHRYEEMGEGVVVVGSMSLVELRGFYNAIDVFVDPTLRPQGLDLTLMEAMMSGKAVMASRFPSIKGTIVVREEFGFMFAPNVGSLREALEKAVEEGAERMAERGRACREYAKGMFTATKMAMAYERLFLCIKNQTFCMYHHSN